jgi:hypothetical protein
MWLAQGADHDSFTQVNQNDAARRQAARFKRFS